MTATRTRIRLHLSIEVVSRWIHSAARKHSSSCDTYHTRSSINPNRCCQSPTTLVMTSTTARKDTHTHQDLPLQQYTPISSVDADPLPIIPAFPPKVNSRPTNNTTALQSLNQQQPSSHHRPDISTLAAQHPVVLSRDSLQNLCLLVLVPILR